MFKVKCRSQNHKIILQKAKRIILQSVVLNGSELWLVTKKSEEKLISCENIVLKIIFGPENKGGIFRIWTI